MLDTKAETGNQNLLLQKADDPDICWEAVITGNWNQTNKQSQLEHIIMPQVRTKAIIETKQKASGTKGNQELQTKKKTNKKTTSPLHMKEFCSETVSPTKLAQVLQKWLTDTGSVSKESTRNAGDLGSFPGLGRSLGGGNAYPLQYSGVENSMDCVVHGVTKSWTRLSFFTFFTV